MTAGSPPAGSYNISSALRALGIRNPRVIPSLGGELTPTVSLGEFESFAPEVIEARGVMLGKINPTLPATSSAIQALAVAPGGFIVENITLNPDGAPPPTARFYLATAPTTFFLGGANFPPWTIGGQALSTLILTGGGFPGILGLPAGGSSTPVIPFPFPMLQTPGLLGRVWVPASWWFAVVVFDNSAATDVCFRFREIPQAQGAP